LDAHAARHDKAVQADFAAEWQVLAMMRRTHAATIGASAVSVVTFFLGRVRFLG